MIVFLLRLLPLICSRNGGSDESQFSHRILHRLRPEELAQHLRAGMESLRSRLKTISSSIPKLPRLPNTTQTRLAIVSQTHLAVLDSDPASVRLHPLNLSHSPTIHPIPEDADCLYAAKDMVAITGPRSITVLHNPSRPRVHPVAEALFRTRPSLTVLHAAWSPHSQAFLAVLTSDACLRLFDVVTSRASATERWRLSLVTAGGAPISFAFGRGPDWHSLVVYVLCEDGAVYVCTPVAPIGTSLPTTSWTRMRDSAEAIVHQHSEPEGAGNIERDDDVIWSARQAAMQLRFLDTFEAKDDRMICVREFKPAPLLVQGPVYVEQDDVIEDVKYVGLTLLECGVAPPVLLRVSEHGEVSVLVLMERVEPQWFLSAEFADLGSTEYGETARTVAPAVLAFEHLAFDAPLTVVPIGGSPDADILFAATSTAVFSIRLSFVSVITNANVLERTPRTAISQMLTTSTEQGQGNKISGLVPSYARNEGPVGIVLTSNGSLHATAPVRWVADFDIILPPRLLKAPQSDSTWNIERPLRGSSAYACPDAGKDVTELLQTVSTLQGKHCSHVAPGTLGKVGGNPKLSSVVSFLESRIDGLAGGVGGLGLVDTLTNLAGVVTQWRDELEEHASSNAEETVDIQDVLERVKSSESALKHKLIRVEEVARLLAERMQTVRETLKSDNSQLSPAEAERYRRLKEKKRRMAALRHRIEELSAAVKSRRTVSQETAATSFYSPVRPQRRVSGRSPASTPRRGNRLSSSPLWRLEEPLSRKRPEWSPRRDTMPLSRNELERVKGSLETHSQEISEAMELSSSLWKRLSVA